MSWVSLLGSGPPQKAVRTKNRPEGRAAGATLVLAFGGGVGFGFVVLAAEEFEAGGIVDGEFGSFGQLFDRSRNGHFGQQLNAAIVLETGTGRDEAAHDDVFLQSAEVVHLAG